MILRDNIVVGALILIFLHPDLPKIFGHILKISMFSFYNLQHSGTLFWFFFKHENSELQFRKRTKEKMVRFFCVYVKLTKLKKLSTLWTLFLPLYDKSCKIWIKKEIKISFSFIKMVHCGVLEVGGVIVEGRIVQVLSTWKLQIQLDRKNCTPLHSLSMVVAMHKKSCNRAFNKEPVNTMETNSL